MTAPVMSRPVAVEARLSFEDFFESSARQVAAIVALTTGDAALAEDATQEAMTRAYAKWDRVSMLERPDLWVTRVAANLAIDAWRRRRREVGLTDASAHPEPRDEIRALWVRWAMERLTPEDRLLLILRHRDGLSVNEIGALMAKSPHTVTKYLKRARRRFRAVASEGDE
jgi:RNA polymerase sigma-70 factor (ECF subfamily)